MDIKLRPYQEEIIKQSLSALDQSKRIVICLSTGAGKTVIAKYLIENFLPKRIFFIVNRIELVNQTLNTFGSDKVSILKAGMENDFFPDRPIQIVMLQTWNARKEKINLPAPDIVIIDEFHIGTESGVMFENFFTKYPDAKIIGMTATPIDENGCKMDNYDVLIDPYRTKDLQDLGFLVKDRWFSSNKNLNLEDIKIQNGDYLEAELSAIMRGVVALQDAVMNFQKFAKEKKTIVFAVDIKHAEELYKEFYVLGYKVALLHSEIKDLEKNRKKILEDFKSGATQIIINVGILTTGFDETSVECVLFARPTKSLRLYIQMAGRGLRLHENKTECLFIDCSNNVWEHGLATDNFDFTIPKEKKKKKEKTLVRMCPECESANPYSRETCIHCGFNFEINKRDREYKILNDNVTEINIDDVTVREKGFPDLKHVMELFLIAKNRNEKTKFKSVGEISWYIKNLHKEFGHRFQHDTLFLKFLQEKLIRIIRMKHSFYRLKFDLQDHFEVENKSLIDQLKKIRGEYPEPCPICKGKMFRNDKEGKETYFCQGCGMGFNIKILKEHHAF